MESFIRSKYESRRWALDGPPPPDPSVLDSETVASEEPVEAAPAPPVAPDPIGWGAPAPPRASNPTIPRHSQPRSLISPNHVNNQPAAPLMKPPPQQQAPAPAPAPPKQTVEELFSLDFHAPAAPASPPPPTNAKKDIMSLFSTPAPAPVVSPQFGQFQQQPSPWGAPAQQYATQAPPQSLMGNNGTGMWGASSGWAAPQPPQQQSSLWGSPPAQQQQSAFGAPQQQPNAFGAVADTNSVWGGSTTGGSADLFSTPFAQAPAQQKKDDAFGDLWGGFK